MLQAGLPARFYNFAGRHYAMMENASFSDASESAWFRTHGEEFPGKRLPFGCKVICKPSPTKHKEVHKMEARTITGILCGYVLHPGYTWHGEYCVWDLNEFTMVDLSIKALPHRNLAKALSHPHITKRVELPEEGIVFPLKAEYDRVNFTLEGMREIAAREGIEPEDPFEVGNEFKDAMGAQNGSEASGPQPAEPLREAHGSAETPALADQTTTPEEPAQNGQEALAPQPVETKRCEKAVKLAMEKGFYTGDDPPQGRGDYEKRDLDGAWVRVEGTITGALRRYPVNKFGERIRMPRGVSIKRRFDLLMISRVRLGTK